MHSSPSPKRHTFSLVLCASGLLAMLAGCPISDLTLPGINQDPTADAGADITIDVGQRVTLNALGSTDADDDALTFAWQQRSGPPVTLDGANTPQPNFVPVTDGFYEFALTVTDGRGGSDISVVRVFVGDVDPATCPRADAGTDQTVNEGAAVRLRGGNSADPAGGPLTFDWFQLSGPQVSINGVFIAEPSFAAPQVTGADVELEFELTATNEQGCPDRDTVVITVRDRDPGDPCNGVVCGDDGLFCNGVEFCENGACSSSGTPCSDAETCEEQSDACTTAPCDTDADCDDGLFCNGTETCDHGSCQANADSLVDTYSTVSNPSGNWTYARTNSVTASTVDVLGVRWEAGWYLGNFGHGGPSVLDSTGTGPSLWAKDNSNGFPVIRWTAPSAGVYDVLGEFEGNDPRGVNNNVYVVVNGAIEFNDLLTSPSDIAPFTMNALALSSGDYVDFTLTNNGGNTEFGWTRINAAITPSSTPCSANQTCDEENDSCTATLNCTTDADCDDGLFCNGAETCVAGECQVGDAPCATGQSCDEASDECTTATLFQDFELGQRLWFADNGVWEVGSPITGPGSCHQGTQCAGTVLNGNYPFTASRLVSPAVRLRDGTVLDPIFLRFWHWFAWGGATGGAPGRGVVQVSVFDTTQETFSEWMDVSTFFSSSSGVWTQGVVDLTTFSGELVKLAFFHQGANAFSSGAGWFVDEIEIVGLDACSDDPSPAVSSLQDWELGQGLWSPDNGVWEIGSPTAGPGACHQGTQCAGTVLDGNYPFAATRLISPAFQLPEGPRTALTPLLLSFWHWFAWGGATGGAPGRGVVQISVFDTTQETFSEWMDVSTFFSSSSGAWTLHLVDISEFAGEIVKLGLFHQGANAFSTGAGWYVDEIEVLEVSGCAAEAP